MTSTFQRARRPEQLAARRSAILAAARAALESRRIDEVTLRDISEGVGLAKSNVLRYFDSREAIFLELLDEECRAWLAELEDGFGQPRARKPAYANEIRIADIIAETLAERRLMCELLGAMAGVLERNISLDVRPRLQGPRHGEHRRTVRPGRRAAAVAARGVRRVHRRGAS